MKPMSDLIITRRGGVVFVTLNRPDALNALNFPMIRGLNDVLSYVENDSEIWGICLLGAGDRAFCAGGDIKAARDGILAWKAGLAKLEDTLQFFREEYALNRRMFHYPKPLIAIMNGITMGGGVGIAGPCRYRIATEKTVWAMPEVSIGFFPDVGAGYYLTRASGQAGTYLGLTGQPLKKAADIMACGFATHFVPMNAENELLEKLAAAENPSGIEAILQSVSSEAPSGSDLNWKEIDLHFGYDTMEGIVQSLGESPIAAVLRAKCPVSLKVTLYHLRQSAREEFDSVIARDLSLAEHLITRDDFIEGVRAAVVDKDRNPKWNPSRLEDAVVDLRLS
jgi:enoyl-CoA hydratase